jgi:hypothetical protein
VSSKGKARFNFVDKWARIVLKFNVSLSIEVEVSLEKLDKDLLACKDNWCITFKKRGG